MIAMTLMAVLSTAPVVANPDERNVSLMTTQALGDELSSMRVQHSPLFFATGGGMIAGGLFGYVYASLLGYSMSWFSGESWTYRPEREPLMFTGLVVAGAGLVMICVGIALRIAVHGRYTQVADELDRREEEAEPTPELRLAPAPSSRLPAVPNQVGVTLLQF